jgi:hypothetical protein
MAARQTDRWDNLLKVVVIVVFGGAVVGWIYFTFFGFHWA